MRDRTYTTGTGQVLHNVHRKTDFCEHYGCAIHHPTDPNKDWPTHWTGAEVGLVRLHPETGQWKFDLDEVNYRLRQVESVTQPDLILGPWVYCKSHVAAHRTGWCSVSLDNKVKLDVTEEMTGEEVMQVVWDMGLPIYGYCDDCHEWIANERNHVCGESHGE